MYWVLKDRLEEVGKGKVVRLQGAHVFPGLTAIFRKPRKTSAPKIFSKATAADISRLD